MSLRESAAAARVQECLEANGRDIRQAFDSMNIGHVFGDHLTFDTLAVFLSFPAQALAIPEEQLATFWGMHARAIMVAVEVDRGGV